MAACSSGNVKKLRLLGYEEKPFLDLLEMYAEEQMDEEFDEDAQNSYKIDYTKGWESSQLDSTELSSNVVPWTFMIVWTSVSEGDVENATVKFFAKEYEGQNLIRIEGAYLDEYGYVEEYYDREYIDLILESIFRELY